MNYSNDQVVLAKIEVTEGLDAAPTAALNAVKAGKVMPGYSFNEIQRLALTKGINAIKKLIGQETMTFDIPVELKGSGAPTTAAEWSVLLRMCGYKEASVAAKVVCAKELGYGNSSLPATLTVASAGTYTPSVPKRYIVTVSLGGASGAATVDIVCPEDATENSTNNVVTTATPVTLGAGGGTITFTFASGNLVLGDKWVVFCQVPGKRYVPISTSDTPETGTIWLHIGGHLWKAVACRGDFSIKMDAGVIGSITFKMKGKFGGMTDAAVPTDAVYQEAVLPAIVENAGACFDATKTLVIRSMAFESGNNLQERKDINSAMGIKGYRSGVRSPTFTARIESEPEATFGVMLKLRARDEILLNAAVGSVSGNSIDVYARRAVFDAPGFTDESDLLMNDLGGLCLQAHEGDKMIEVFTR